MTLENVVPMNHKPNNVPPRIWSTLQALVWCNNSLNAIAGTHRRLGDDRTVQYLNRAQEVITALLSETGRLNELQEWENVQNLVAYWRRQTSDGQN